MPAEALIGACSQQDIANAISNSLMDHIRSAETEV